MDGVRDQYLLHWYKKLSSVEVRPSTQCFDMPPSAAHAYLLSLLTISLTPYPSQTMIQETSRLKDIRGRALSYQNCPWLTIDYTLQELLAPGNIKFYNREVEFPGELRRHQATHFLQSPRLTRQLSRSHDSLGTILSHFECWGDSKRGTKRRKRTQPIYCLLNILMYECQ